METDRDVSMRLLHSLLGELQPLNPSERKKLLAWIEGTPTEDVLVDEPGERFAQMLVDQICIHESRRYSFVGLRLIIDGWPLHVTSVKFGDAVEVLCIRDDVADRARPLTFLDLALDPRTYRTMRGSLKSEIWERERGYYPVYDYFCEVWENRVGMPLWIKRWFVWHRTPIDLDVIERAKRLVRERHGWYSPNERPADAPRQLTTTA